MHSPARVRSETHKASKDFYPLYGYARRGCVARVELYCPIGYSFSTLAAMTVDGIIDWYVLRTRPGQQRR